MSRTIKVKWKNAKMENVTPLPFLECTALRLAGPILQA
jgi:hypothetical protein